MNRQAALHDRVYNVRQADLISYEQQLVKMDQSIAAGNLHKVISDSSTAIDQVLHQHLLVLLDNRAHAYAKVGLFDLAYADAQRMIELAPRSYTGHIRKGDILAMYGLQERAIEAYTQGCQRAQLDCNPQIQLNRAYAN